jgi:peptidoglycan/xylan/chitin deacetylase (PgdA/CDA1 family)
MLGTMTNLDEIKAELTESARLIEKNLGHFPKTISYPVGSYNETTIKLSREAGYSIGLAVKQRPYLPMTDSIFEIPRIELYNENWLKTVLRITNFLETIKTTIGYR